MRWRGEAIEIMQAAAQRRAEPVILSSGETTEVYLDVKGVLTTFSRMIIAASAMIDLVGDLRPTAIGGPTMGADVLTHAMISLDMIGDPAWFSVRDRRKTDHGLGLWIEGHRLTAADRVVLTDDVASSGKSLIEAYERVLETGAEIIAVAPFVDRGGVAEGWLSSLGYDAPYMPLMTYEDLGLEPLARKRVLT